MSCATMPEIEVHELDARWKAQALRICAAREAGDAAYVRSAVHPVLEAYPGCLELRRQLRWAQGEELKGRGRFRLFLAHLRVWLFHCLTIRPTPEKAFQCSERALELHAGCVAALRLQASAARALNFPLTAAFAQEQICERRPEDPRETIRWGAALVRAGRADEAIRIAELLLASGRDDASARALLKDASVAKSLMQGGWIPMKETGSEVAEGMAAASARSSGRVVELEAAIAERPEEIALYRELAELWMALAEPVAALQWVRKGLRVPGAATDERMLQLEGRLQSKVLQQGVNMARAQVEANPEDPAARAALAGAEADAHAFTRARLAALVERFPDSAHHRLEYGELLVEQGDADSAVLHFQMASGEASLHGRALAGLGRAERMRGRYDSALKHLEESLRRLPVGETHHLAAAYEQADLLQLLGRDEEAVVRFAAIREEAPGYRDVDARLGALLRPPPANA